MGGKPEQGACTSAADLPQITTVVRHMQKMTWQAQGAARDARAIELSGKRCAIVCCAFDFGFPLICCMCWYWYSSPSHGEGLSSSSRSTIVSQASSPRGWTTSISSRHNASGRSPSMRPMSFKEASRVPPRGGGSGGDSSSPRRVVDKGSPRFPDRDLGRYVVQ